MEDAIEAMILYNKHHRVEVSRIFNKLKRIPIMTHTIVGCLLELKTYKNMIEKTEKHLFKMKN